MDNTHDERGVHGVDVDNVDVKDVGDVVWKK